MCTIHYTSENLIESTNVGFHSSIVEEGTGTAVVIAIGDNTLLGKMSRKKNVYSENNITGLHREVNRFVLFVCVATIIAIAVLWATWAFWLNRDHHSFLTYNGNIINSIGMIIAFLPLGLPSTVTLGK
jgi:sodium/potassium-transporting ATPase subunit alpha